MTTGAEEMDVTEKVTGIEQCTKFDIITKLYIKRIFSKE